ETIALASSPNCAQIRPFFDFFAEDSWRLSNDVGDVKTHVLRAGRRSRLSTAKSRRRRPLLCRRSVRCPRSALDPCRCITTVSGTRHLVGHQRTMMTSCELPPREGGASPNQCFGHSRTRTNANTGTPARTPRVRLPRQATTAAFRVVDLIAHHDPETNP